MKRKYLIVVADYYKDIAQGLLDSNLLQLLSILFSLNNFLFDNSYTITI